MSVDDVAIKRLVQQHWARRAAMFDEGLTHAVHSEAQREAWLAVLRELAGSRPLRVLDLGCGTGFLALLLAGLGHTVTGLDFALPMLALARAKAAAAGLVIDFREGDAELLSDAAGAYDLVVERHLIWTLPRPDRALQEWRRVLTPGGRVALIEGYWGQRQGTDEYEQIRDQLPLGTGAESERLVHFLASCGYQDMAAKPLMDDVLWGSAPQHARYAVTART